MTATLDPTTAAPAPAAVDAATPDPTARLMQAAAVIGPALLVASSIDWIVGGDATQLRAILTMWALPFMALAAYGLASRLHGRGRAVVTALVAIGVCGGAGFATEIAFVEHFGVERLMEQDTPSAFLTLGIPGPCFPLGLLVLGLLSLRHRTLPRWQAAALAAGAVLFPLSRIPQVPALALVCDLLLVAAFAPIALTAARGPRAAA